MASTFRTFPPLLACTAALIWGCAARKTPNSSDSEATRTAGRGDTRVTQTPPDTLSPPTSPLALTDTAPVGAPELPPLSGATTNLDMVSLTQTIQTFTIESDTSMFTATDPRVAGRLQLALQFDPRWRVGLWGGQRVAWSRLADPQGWSAPWGGYRDTDGHTIRSMFRFEARPDQHPWSASGLVARNVAGATTMQVVAWKVDRGLWKDQLAAAFTIDGAGMSLEVHEISPRLTLAGTQKELQQATMRTRAIADQVARGNLQRTSLAMVPRGEPRIGSPFVQVAQQEGSLDVRGRVSTSEPGWLWVRLVQPDGQAWEEDMVALATAERTGWDTNPEVVSYFQSTIPHAAAAPTEGRVEVWFQSDASSEIRQLGTFAIRADTAPAH